MREPKQILICNIVRLPEGNLKKVFSSLKEEKTAFKALLRSIFLLNVLQVTNMYPVISTNLHYIFRLLFIALNLMHEPHAGSVMCLIFTRRVPGVALIAFLLPLLCKPIGENFPSVGIDTSAESYSWSPSFFTIFACTLSPLQLLLHIQPVWSEQGGWTRLILLLGMQDKLCLPTGFKDMIWLKIAQSCKSVNISVSVVKMF